MLPTVMFVLGALAVLAIILAVADYNRLATLRNCYRNAYAQSDVQLKRRYDLIPNLVQTAQGYIKHERGALQSVIAARNAAFSANATAAQNPGDAGTMQELNAAEGQLAGSLGRFLAVAEAYPELKADRQMLQLMEDLTSTENRIAFARQAYNDAVMFYNTACQTFPSALIARTFGFAPAGMFTVDDASVKLAPNISFP